MTNNTVTFNGFRGEYLTINTANLTDLETKVMVNARTNYFSDICKVAVEYSKALYCGLFGLDIEKVRGAVESLANKGYMGIVSINDTEDYIFYITDNGKKLYSDYN